MSLICRVCGAVVDAADSECAWCGSRRPFACGVCGLPVETPLHPEQIREDGTVACTRHAPWARCLLCGRIGTYAEVTAGKWVYLDSSNGAIGRYLAVVADLASLRHAWRWLCPDCFDAGQHAVSGRDRLSCLARASGTLWLLWRWRGRRFPPHTAGRK